ncbi:MAG: cell division FtsZ family protein [Kiritimatiellae bacterium]|nr:cell division FtsZ family protein [Kiritimatiellia bacterium]
MNPSDRILICGIGGGGCAMLGALAQGWPEIPECAVVHSEAEGLSAAGVDRSVLLGGTVRMGVSMGGDMARGRRLAESSERELRQLVTDRDLVILIVTLGGGTGSAVAPYLADLARQSGALTLVFCTTPLRFEGPQRQSNADVALHELHRTAGAVVVFPNQRLAEWFGGSVSIIEAFDRVNTIIGRHVRAVWNTLRRPGLLRADVMDLRRMVERGNGVLSVAHGEAEGANRAADAVNELVSSPMMEGGSVLSAAAGLFVAIAGGSDLRLEEIELLTDELRRRARSDVEFILGASICPAYEGRLAVTLLASETLAALPAEEPSLAETTAGETAAPSGATPPPRGARRGRRGKQQIELPLQPTQQGRFANLAPTVYGGEDMDQPTFRRRRIDLKAL